jgi:hypothetical protein
VRMASWLSIPVLLLLLPGLAAADDDPSGFSFEPPRFSASVRGGRVFARGGSDLFDFVRDELTIEKNDFNSPAIASEFGFTLTPRLEAVFGFEYTQAGVPSEYRRFVKRTTGAPITQTTSLKTMQLGGSLKWAVLGRGHEVGRFAWVPRLITPYVGAGAGAMQYDFLQDGEFVDFVDRTVFQDYFQAKGWTPSAHAFAGADVKLTRWLFASVEARYVWAAGDLGETFADFEPIDLSGLRTAFGVNVRF